jgi:hypothetical protein
VPVTILDPNLRAGWEPDTPVEDSLLRRFVVNWATTLDALGSTLGARRLQRDDLAAVDVGRPAGLFNSVTLLAPLYPEQVDNLLTTLDDFFGFSTPGRSGPVVIFSCWPSPDLRPHGWSLVGHPPLMLRPAGGALPPPPAGLCITEVTNETDLRAFEQTIVRGFPEPELEAQGPGAAFGSSLLADRRMRLWVGYEDERPVSAAACSVAAGINNVALVATVPEARRRGYGEALTWRATLADPALPAVLFASDDGRPVYERMGYTALFRLTLWSHNRG